ncbi:GNAT family N-acetyltransferase [Kaistella yonginensis]|uniref:GNAT family N-acetyltransferase n=1 Tax=Kaistella yonginensis TaxID=658267 RepID=UPI0025B4AE3C|nr:GNAT family N-acetyltransferase [Kaistella yonginensis]MDN3606580.1 GNAT family N-acetyltransferase [Kaistella yonginensis]
MIWFQELQTRKKLSRIFSSYEKTFPADERRDEAQFLALLENPNSLIFIIKNEENSIGYVILWELNDFYFLEHFEVFEEFRNLKLGSQVLQELQEKFGNMILESEPSDWNEMAERRINFYVRNGYSIVSKEYVQPSYGEGKKELKLFLLGNFKVENLMAVEFELRSKVYDSI